MESDYKIGALAYFEVLARTPRKITVYKAFVLIFEPGTSHIRSKNINNSTALFCPRLRARWF
jgi:hypothetical protein